MLSALEEKTEHECLQRNGQMNNSTDRVIKTNSKDAK